MIEGVSQNSLVGKFLVGFPVLDCLF